jgi:hypothetical protein
MHLRVKLYRLRTGSSLEIVVKANNTAELEQLIARDYPDWEIGNVVPT